ncbi:hypothetical protein [Haloarcula marina]|uniref:hypothetical protein n=1 Tax=Haloarcula marina TaxID=2961574 RepID=UPI0020B6F199|nr:hypothetical protein [Halomicroarcula marina]
MVDLASMREPSYTGENRCWPCTLVNLAVVGVFVLWLAVRKRRVLSLVVATVGVGIVYLRGYVVPYTPRFAPQLVDASPLPNDLFHDAIDEHEAERESLADADLDGETVMRELGAAGVLVAEGEMLLLADEVDEAWRDEMDALASLSLSDLAAEVERSMPNVGRADTLVTDGSEWVVVGDAGGELVARPVAIAELAAYRTLGYRIDDEAVRLAGAESFRMFLEACPACGTALVESSEVSCCGGYMTPRQSPNETLVCPSCEQRLFTFPSE